MIETAIMRFHVPQFIEVESKIFGPLTLKQFIYLAGGAGMAAIAWFFSPNTTVAVVLILPIAGLSLALAFYKLHGRSFVEILEAAFYYLMGSKLFIWQKRPHPPSETGEEDPAAAATADLPRLSNSKLREMTWNLDVSNGTQSDRTDASAEKRAERSE